MKTIRDNFDPYRNVGLIIYYNYELILRRSDKEENQMSGIKDSIKEIIRESDTVTKFLLVAAFGTIFCLGLWIGILINIWSVTKHFH